MECMTCGGLFIMRFDLLWMVFLVCDGTLPWLPTTYHLFGFRGWFVSMCGFKARYYGLIDLRTSVLVLGLTPPASYYSQETLPRLIPLLLRSSIASSRWVFLLCLRSLLLKVSITQSAMSYVLHPVLKFQDPWSQSWVSVYSALVMALGPCCSLVSIMLLVFRCSPRCLTVNLVLFCKLWFWGSSTLSVIPGSK